MQPSAYAAWLCRVFVRDALQMGWLYPTEPRMLVDLVHATLMRSGSDLAQFSDKQVATGLDLIFNPALSEIIFALVPEANACATSASLACG